MKSIWIDGLEQISAIGIGSKALIDKQGYSFDFWQKLYPFALIGDEFNFYEVTGWKESSEIRQMDQLTKCTMACMQLVLEKSGIKENFINIDRDRIGIIIGSAFGCTASNHTFLETLISEGPLRTSPVVFRNTVSNAVAGHLAIKFRIFGSNSVLNSGTVSGLQAMAYAFEEVASGHCDMVLSGASDCTSDLIRKRFLFCVGEQGHEMLPMMDGATMLVLYADQNRNIPGWQMIGYGMGFLHKQDLEAGFVRVIRKALDSADIDSSDLDIIQLQMDQSVFWVRSTPYDSLETVCTQLLRKIPCFPSQKNTAVPVMLSLMTSLICLPNGHIPHLFIDDNAITKFERTLKNFLFVTIGDDGNIVAIIFNYVQRFDRE